MNHKNIPHYIQTKCISVTTSFELELKIPIAILMPSWHKVAWEGGEAQWERDSGLNQL